MASLKILITGGCGFLGSNLAAECLRRSVELVVLDDLSRLGSAQNLRWLRGQGKFRFVRSDIRDFDSVRDLIRETRPGAVFHLAGQVAMSTSLADPRRDFEINAVGSHNVLEAVRLHVPEAAVLFSSTNKVYGDLEQYTYIEAETRYECAEYPNGFDESIPLSFHSPYGCSKGAADQYMLDYARMFGLRTIVFRHSSMYGGRQFPTYDQGWVGWFCQQAIESARAEGGMPLEISGSGKQVRDVLNAADVVTLYFLALEHIETASGNAFNIGGGMEASLSLVELFRLLERLLGTPLAYSRLPARRSDQRVFVADNSKAARMLGWRPKIGREAGIQAMLDWVATSEHSS